MKLLVEEPGSDEATRVWTESANRVSSLLLYPEACAAVAAAARGGRLGRTTSTRWRRTLERLWDEVEHSTLTIGLARRAGDLAELHGLRGYDAVHLASFERVADENVVLLTFDEDLRIAARSLGLAVAPAIAL